MHCLDALFATPAIQCCNTIIGEFFLLQSLLLRASFGSQKYTCILVYVLKTLSAYERCCHGQSSPLEKWVLSVALSFQRLEHHCAGQCANMKYHAQPIYFTLFYKVCMRYVDKQHGHHCDDLGLWFLIGWGLTLLLI